MKTVSIIGAGASGLACLKELIPYQDRLNLVLFDRNSSIAKKIAATGNGRCNLSNTNITLNAYQGDIEPLFDRVADFDIQQFCTDLGFLTRLKGNLYYPYSEQAKTVVNAFQRMVNKSSTQLFLDTEIKRIKYKNNSYELIDQKGNRYFSDYIVIGAGAKASKGFGTDGAIFDVLRELEIHSTPLIPSLVAMNTKENVKKLKGCRFHGTFTLKENGEQVANYPGEALITDSGISGIACMQLSRFLDFSKNNVYTLHCNLVDHLTIEQLKSYYHQQTVLYHGIVQEKLADYLAYRETNSFNDFYTRLTNLTFTIIGTRNHEQAQVTRGGIPLSYLDESLMVKKYPHLYLCGEVLNVDGDCGGYNLHFAFATGQIVGKEIASQIDI